MFPPSQGNLILCLPRVHAHTLAAYAPVLKELHHFETYLACQSSVRVVDAVALVFSGLQW